MKPKTEEDTFPAKFKALRGSVPSNIDLEQHKDALVDSAASEDDVDEFLREIKTAMGRQE